MHWITFLSIYSFLILPWLSSAIRMTQPKILLPFHPRIETNFTLEATDGCFLWTSTRPDLVRIEPLGPFLMKNGENCSLHANIIAHTKQYARASATVYARDIITGQSVRCDVIIDKVQSMEIVYTTTRLYLEDAPELFKLRAHDQHGSTFSSIEHFSYEWRLLNAATSDEQVTKKSTSSVLDASKVIRILRLTDSSYEMSETVRNLESHGSLSYEILLEGLRTGSAFVQAELIDQDFYENIRTKSVRLSVSANVQFYPSTDVYLLPYSRLGFRLYQIKRQESTDITDLPSTRILYEVKLINDDAGTLDDQTLIFTATDHADEQSRLELIDRNMKAIDHDTYEPISLMIRIVNIGYLSAITNSSRPWIYQLGSFYLVTIEMFDVNGRKIYPTDNLDLIATIPNPEHQTCLTLTSLNINGTQWVVRPNCPGRFELEFRLNGVKTDQPLEMPITASSRQWFEVYLPIVARPKRFLLPDRSFNQESKLSSCPIEVLGGSGDYWFTSQDTNVATVSAQGHLQAQHSLNSTAIDIYDKKSPEFYTNVSVTVVQPDEFHFYPCPVETDLQSMLYLPIQLFFQKQAITCCSQLIFDINIDNQIFQYQGLASNSDQSDNNQSCALLVLKPIRVGITTVRIQLKKSNLQQSILVSAFERLAIHRRQLLLTNDAEFTLELLNGPNSFNLQVPFEFEITPANAHVRFSQDLSHTNLLRVKCLNSMEKTSFQISKSNAISKFNRCPIPSSIVLDVTCQAHIHSFTFKPLISAECPLINEKSIVSSAHEPLTIEVIAFDEHQVRFDNFTSLKLSCSIKSKPELADLKVTDRIYIVPKNRAGRVELECSLDKIQRTLEIEFLSHIETGNPIQLIYINETMSPLTISGGSGYFKFQTKELLDNPLIKIMTDEKNSRLILIEPLNYGRTTLNILDQCLPSVQKEIDVIVANIDRLKVFGRSRIEFNTSSLLYLQAVDDQGNLFNLTNIYSLMNIQIEQTSKSEILAIQYEAKSNFDDQTLAYRLNTLELGRTHLTFNSLQAKSTRNEFEVYEKLRIEPKHMRILPLSTFQLIVHGGSQAGGTTVEWSTNHSKIVDLTTLNIFKSKQIGQALIRAKSIGIDPLLGSAVVYGEDTCLVEVVQIHSISLHIPSNEILPKKSVPLTVLPYDERKQLILVTDVYLHSLTFTWSLSNTHLAQFRSVIGNLSSYSRTFTTNLETLRSGHITIDVQLTANHKDHGKILLHSASQFTDSVELNILDPFFVNQFDETRTILLGPNSRLELFHISHDITLELSSSKNIVLDSRAKMLISDSNQYAEAILYMKYRATKQDKRTGIVGAYLVQVKPIHYILLQSSLPSETSSLFSSIPVDYKLPLTVSFHDEFGRKFDATSIGLKTFSPRFDMISSTVNHSQVYEIVPLKNGSNVLIFHDDSDHLRAYLPMQSTHGFLFPSSNNVLSKQNYFIGDVVCFQSDLSEDQMNRWKADDGMMIDSQYGIGQMIIDGERHLYLTIDGQTLTSERFHVQVPNEIKLIKGNNNFLYDGEQDKPMTFSVLIGSDSKKNLYGECSREGIEHAQSLGVLRPTFECRLEFISSSSSYLKAATLFKTQAVFDIDLMSWACQVTSLSNTVDQRHSSTHDDSLRLFVQTSSSLRSNELILSYQPTFKLSSTSAIYLSEEHPYQSIEIYTLISNEKFIRVLSSDPSMIRVNKNSTDPFVYNVELRHGAKTNNPDSIYIEVHNTLTGQRQQIQVRVQKRFIDNPIGRIFASLILCASLALIVYGLANRKSTPTASSNVIISKPNSPSPRVLHSPATPKRHLLFDEQQTTTPFDRNPLDSPRSTVFNSQDQPPVRLYSAHDIRARPFANTPRSAMSNLTLLTNDETDLERRLRRFRDEN